MRAYARLTGRRRKISPPSLPRSSLSSLLASPRDGNCFRREKRREEESLPLSRSSLSLSRPPSLSRLPPSSYLGDAEPAAGYLPTPEAAPQRQLKSRAPPPLSLAALSSPSYLIFFPRLSSPSADTWRPGGFRPVSLRRGLDVDAQWTTILLCQQPGLDLTSFLKGWGRSGGFKRLG